jgi:hypothetical protein
MKNNWTKAKKNVKKITKRNNSTLNLNQAEWTKKSKKENEIKLCRIVKITVESTFFATNAAWAERERWHSTIYKIIYLYLISCLICFVTSSSLISVLSHHNMSFINLNIKDLELIEMNRQDIHRTLNHSATIRSMMTIENINLEIFFRIIRIIKITQTRLILILILFIQNSRQVKMILTELKNHFSIQINSQTSMNIHLDLIQSEIFHSKMIHILLRRYVRIESRNLHSHLDRMNSIEETTNTKARFIMRRWRSRIWSRRILKKTNMTRNIHRKSRIKIYSWTSLNKTIRKTNYIMKKSS